MIINQVLGFLWKYLLKRYGIGVGFYTMMTTKIKFSLITTTHINEFDEQSKNN